MLVDAVTSALKQDYPNLEVIISDDASNDNTEEVAQSFANDIRFKYFKNNSEHMSLATHLRKACFEYASGDWILILDDDDYLIDSNYISKVIDVINTDADIVMVHSNCKVLLEDTGEFIDMNKTLPPVSDGRWIFINYKYAYYGNINCYTLTVVFNRNVAMAVKAFHDDSVTYGEDRESWLKIALKGKVGFLKGLSAVYRIHGNNVTRQIDINTFFASMGSILNPYEFAKQGGYFDANVLERWKRRMIREICEIWLVCSLTTCRNKVARLSEFITRLSREHPFALLSVLKIFKPKTFVKILLSGFNNLIAHQWTYNNRQPHEQLPETEWLGR
jgi:glycosyltransferase involved in cell wall biosynthesis